MLSETLAGLATIFLVSGYVPQLLEAFKKRSLKSVPLPAIAAVTFGVFLWELYAVVNGDMIYLVWNSVLLTFTSVLLFMKVYYDGPY